MDGQSEAIERLYKSLTNTLLFLSLLVFFLSVTMVVSDRDGASSAQGLLTAFVMVMMMIVYIGFRSRKEWAIKWARVHWVFLMFVCGIVGFADIMSGLNGDFLSLALGVMLAMIVFGMYRRLPTFNNPLFIAWYLGREDFLAATLNLNEGEVAASCPHCNSLLAVIAHKLNPDDICPLCSGRLVSVETVEKFAEEE